MRSKHRAGLAMLIMLSAFLAFPDASRAAELPQNGLVLWLDAADSASLKLSDGLVEGWQNKAPGCSNVFQSRKDQRPRFLKAPGAGVRPAIHFDGQDDVLIDSQFNRQSKTWTLVVVAAALPGNRGGGLVTGRNAGGDDYDPGFTFDLYQTAALFNSLSVEGAGRIGGQANQMTMTFPLGGLHMIVVERAPEEIRLRVDGNGQMTRAAKPEATQMKELRIGARCYGGKERHYLSGLISQVMLYDRVLKPEELRQVEAMVKVEAKEHSAGELAAASTALAERKQPVAMPPKLVAQWADLDSYLQSPLARGVLREVENPVAGLPIRTDLRTAIALSVEHLASLFDRDHDNEPFFYSNRREDGMGEMFHSVNIGIPHVVGRCLLGILAAEEATGIPAPADGVAILTRYCKVQFDDPNHLNSYVDPQRDNKRFIEFHSMREGLYGLVYLMAQRNDSWAREEAQRMLASLDSITDPAGRWSPELAYQKGFARRLEGVSIMNASRMVDPLMKYYRLTRNPLALKLAAGYARQGLSLGFTDDGRFTPMALSSGHIHSITSSLSGIIDYAIFANEREMLEKCIRVMKTGVPEYFSTWGWGDEVMPEHPANVIGRGEINQTGDVIRAALLLGEAVDAAYYDWAERYLRSMILPTQHREPELSQILKDAPHPRTDAECNVLRRSIGGFSMQLPNDRMRPGDWPLSTLDITSGAAHAMSECWNHLIRSTGNVTRVNLLFDCRDKHVEITSHLPLRGRVDFAVCEDHTLMVRVPPWLDTKTIRLMVKREARPVELKSGYIVVAGLQRGAQGSLTFAVPCKVEKEVVDGTEYTTTWVGNQIIGIAPRGPESPLPF